MRVFIAGVDGYLGWSLAQYLAYKGHIVSGLDNCQRRQWVIETGSDSVIPIAPLTTRVILFKKHLGDKHFSGTCSVLGDVANYDLLHACLSEFKPDVIVNLAQMPSAPFSMENYNKCVYTHDNNIKTTLTILWLMKDFFPAVPLVMIGTAGEYGTPGVAIPEGFFDIEYRGKKANLPFPRTPASFYHATKVHSSVNIERACYWWGLSATDIMQGVVYGVNISDNPLMATRFDIDEVFGTAINRFVCQSIIDEPITLYGKGHQKRGFIPLRDSIECLRLVIENPPEKGEYRVINQYDQVYDLTDLANMVKKIGKHWGLDPKIKNIKNPRIELGKHFYEMDREKLVQLGYEPTGSLSSELNIMFNSLLKFKERIFSLKDVLMPTISWK